MLKFLRENWLGVGGLFVGVIGVAASIYTYSSSRRQREPYFITDPARTEILSRDRVGAAPIRVTRSDGQPITSDLTAVRFYFWNAGGEAIKDAHLLEPLVLRIEDPSARVLDYSLLRSSRPVCRFALQPGKTPNTLNVSFRILEHNDGGTGQIIYEGSPSARLTLTGAIEGAVLHTERDLPSGILKGTMQVVVALASMLFLSFVALQLTLWWNRRLEAADPRVKRRAELATMIGTISLIILCVVAFSSVMSHAVDANSERAASLRERVPQTILPASR